MKAKVSLFSERIFSYLQKTFYLDVRSMALFRMGLGAFIIVDLIDRMRSFSVFYTDDSVMPRAFVVDQINRAFDFSIFHFTGDGRLVFLLFLIYAMCAFFLMIGFRTRLFTVLCWIFCVSLINRSPAIVYSGDSVLRMLLFWSMFLPLGLTYSVDAAMSRAKHVSKTWFSAGSVAIILQIVFIYVFTGLHKNHEKWFPDGTALAYAFEVDVYVTPIGIFLKQFGFLLQSLTFGTLILEIFLPLLLLIPLSLSFSRLLNVFSFWAFHLGILLTMYVGLFSWICMVAWILILPGVFWDFLARKCKLHSGKGVIVYYDQDCGFCRKSVLIICTFLGLDKVRIEKGQQFKAIDKIMQKENSWVVQDRYGVFHTRFDAFVCLVEHGFFKKPGVFILTLPWVHRLGNAFYGWVSAHRSEVSIFTKSLKEKDQNYKPWKITEVLVVFFLLYVFLYNLAGFRALDFKLPTILHPVRDTLRLDQRWGMFSLQRTTQNAWYVIYGLTKDQKKINLWFTDFESPLIKPDKIPKKFIYQRWSTYLLRINSSKNKKYRPYFAQYLCDQYNRSRRRDEKIESVLVFLAHYRITIDPEENIEVKQTQLIEHNCFKK